MANIKPFCGLKPARGLEEKVAALPYDVYNRAEAREAVKGRPLSFLNIDRPETQFPPDEDMYAQHVYEKARRMLYDEIEDGTFVQDDKPCFYLYELTMDGRTQTGIVALADVDEYLSGVIARHENTRPEKEADRIRHIDVCGAQTGPIFLAYRKQDRIEAVVSEVKSGAPDYDFVSEDGIRHRGWTISSEEMTAAVRKAFAGVERVYIADGHHRAASAVKVAQKRRAEHPGYTGEEEFNSFLCVLFPDEELKILDYNRLVRDLNGFTPQAFLEKLREKFDVAGPAETPGAVKPGTCGMYLSGHWYCVAFRSDEAAGDPVGALDVSKLQDQILSPLLGITDPANDTRIEFAGGIRGISYLEKRVNTDCAVAFAMAPTTISELFAVADAGLLMPPKSTWFEPKLRSGLYIHLI